MKLGQKLLLIMTVGMIIVTLAIFALTNGVAMNYIEQEERRSIVKSYENTTSLLESEARSLRRSLNDRARSDAAYQFVITPTREYVIENLTEESISALEINYIFFLDSNARLLYFNTERVAPSVRSKEKTELLGRIIERWGDGSFSLEEPYLGLTIIGDHLLMVGGTPITTTDGSQSSGYLIMARYLDNDFLQDLSSILGVTVKVNSSSAPWPFADEVSGMGIQSRKSRNALDFDEANLVLSPQQNYVMAQNILYDSLTGTAIEFHFGLSRESYQYGLSTMKVILAVAITVIAIISSVIILFFNRTILSRIKKLSSFLDMVAKGRDTTQKVSIPGNDEVAALAEHTNTMLAHINKTEETLKWQATHDPLSGLYNRHHFMQLVNDAISTARRGDQYALMLIEMTNFKALKTMRGQAAGDSIITALGGRLREFSMCKMVAARMGRNEYAVLLNLRGDYDINDLSNKLVDELCRPIEMSEDQVTAEINAGVAFYPRHASGIESLFQCADLALTAAKEEGNNIIRRYEPYMAQRFLDRLSILNDLGRAIKNNEFSLRYQPQVDAKTGEIVGAEALIRWEHPEKGLISPMEFIPLAEQSRKIIDIGRWVLFQACKDAMEWILPWTVSVNISAQQVRQRNFIDEVAQALKESGLPPERLVLEITESAFINDKNSLKDMMVQFHKLGISISIDDFGTGYSSLNYLHDFPMDELKIDRSFVSAIGTDMETSSIIETIIVLAKNLHLKTVAEGVETQFQANFLHRKGCSHFQGYLYSKPVLQEEILQKQKESLKEKI